VYAYRDDATDHDRYRTWLEETVRSDATYGMSELALSGFVRVVTHPRIFPAPTPLATALAQADAVRSQPNCILVTPGPRHWEIFAGLCSKADARGDLISDAYFAALAIESGCEWITTDRDYARFPGLRWRHPL
jgi:toxin-antitoxin system PIN domain toxin